VRIVDKQVRKGKLYLKKAVVLDVHPGGTCDVSVEETQEVLQVRVRAVPLL
jgi:G patch domain/KOW motif-containing protein